MWQLHRRPPFESWSVPGSVEFMCAARQCIPIEWGDKINDDLLHGLVKVVESSYCISALCRLMYTVGVVSPSEETVLYLLFT